MSASLEVKFTRKRETKNSVRFQEDPDHGVIGTLYVRKGALQQLGNPESLVVTIANANGD